MAKFAYKNTKNMSSGHTPFELNCSYHLQMFYKKNVNLCSNSNLANKLLAKLKEIIIICQENFYHI